MIKKFIMICIIILLLSMIPGCTSISYDNNNADISNNPQPEVFEGAGTSEDPYLISNLNNMLYLANSVNNEKKSYKNMYFLLTADIDMKGYDWIPIGKKDAWSQNDFMGNFDGNGYTISNYKITKNWTFATGLFASCSNNTLNNITIKNATIRLDAGHNLTEVGLLVGYANECRILNCSTEGSIYMTSDAAQQNLGGIVGNIFAASSSNSSIIKGCKSTIEITSNGPYPNVGGIAGRTTNIDVVECDTISIIEYLSSMASASGGSYNGIGGLIGVNLRADVRECNANINIVGGAGIWKVSGLIGYSEWADIESCHVIGTIKRKNVNSDSAPINDSLISSGTNNQISEDCTCEITCEYD